MSYLRLTVPPPNPPTDSYFSFRRERTYDHPPSPCLYMGRDPQGTSLRHPSSSQGQSVRHVGYLFSPTHLSRRRGKGDSCVTSKPLNSCRPEKLLEDVGRRDLHRRRRGVVGVPRPEIQKDRHLESRRVVSSSWTSLRIVGPNLL